MVTQRQYETEAFESADKKYDLVGSLADDDGNPISDVKLAIKCEDDGSEYSATTDSDGKFLLENVSPGKYTVTVDSDDYDETSQEHQVGEASDDEGSQSEDKEDSSEETDTSDESEAGESPDESSNDSDTEDSENGAAGDDSDN